MRKIFILIIFIPLVVLAFTNREKTQSPEYLRSKLESIPDSVFQNVKQEDLLLDEVYVKLARDGWSADEIKRIMGDYISRNRSKVRGSLEYGRYAKQWLPTYGYMPGGDTLYQFMDTTYTAELFKAAVRMAPRSSDVPYNNYLLTEDYSPAPRKAGQRQPGIFRASKPKPSSGRIHWIQVHPEDPDKIMVIPDGSGIYRTDDCGRTWDLITDRIPDREFRNYATHSAIPVDPDNWDHIYAFMGGTGNPVYRTVDGGQTWTRVAGATHKGFKRGHAFRDADGNLKFIGAVQRSGSSYWSSDLWISEDTCRTWTRVNVPDSLLDNRAESTVRGLWFQESVFHPTDRNKIFFPTSKSIMYFDDGAKSEVVNGVRQYTIKKLHFKVFNQDSTELRCEGVNFPFEATSQAFLNINPNNPNEMWFASASRNVSYNNKTALYRSRDGGKTWITLHEPYAGIGSGTIFGNEAPWGWLGGFGVNYIDSNWIYGCSMSSAISSDGGKNFNEYVWGNRMTSLQDDGNYYSVSNARHNADNHCIISHKSGRVFRGSDAGLLMRDKAVKNNEWINISGDMGQQLFYSIKTNEFGDQLILGNTQDVDVQTYFDGRWGTWRGYEGSFSIIGPYGNTCYYPSGGGGISGLDYGSWASGITAADVCTGNWYVRQDRKLFIVEDFGRSARQVDVKGRYVNMYTLSRDARDNGKSTLWTGTGYNILNYSKDNGNTFSEDIFLPGVSEIQAIAADPDNSNILYVVHKKNNRSYVTKWDVSTLTQLADLTYNLPWMNTVNDLVLHEGSGDIYLRNKNTGIYLLENGSQEWHFWMQGYNASKTGAMSLNYTTQEMVIADYGRGVYIADLENPSDRYFDNGFALKEISNVDGRRTIGIDTQWTIPLYYYYEWTVNGKVVNNPYQYLTYPLAKGDVVKLKLTLRESPDVSTESAEYTVKESASTSVALKAGKALYSNGKGRVDLGYVDYFFNDFTIDLWVKPMTNGTILANRQKTPEREVKGWWLGLENGSLKFRVSPATVFNRPTYEADFVQQSTLDGGALTMGEWSHIAVTETRNGTIAIYVNGVKRGEQQRIRPEFSLNNSLYLSLFADAYEWQELEGAVDELKIWNYALSEDEVRKAAYSHKTDNVNGLVYYNGFNNGSLAADKEQFTAVEPKIRTRAEVSYVDMPISVGATYATSATVSGSTSFVDGDQTLLTLEPGEGVSSAVKMWVYGYTDRNWLEISPSNLDAEKYILQPMAFQIKSYNGVVGENDLYTISIPAADVDAGKVYRLYKAPANKMPDYWQEVGDMVYDAENKVLKMENVALHGLLGSRLIIAHLERGIEVKVKGVSSMGAVELYDEEPVSFELDAQLMGTEPEPTGSYAIKTDHQFAKPLGDLSFVKGSASTQLRINPFGFGEFGTEQVVNITGEDDRLIAYPLKVVNKITTKTIGDGLVLDKGGAYLGTASIYQPLNQSNTVTLMGWVRMDSANVLTGNKPLIFFRSGSVGATGIHLSNGQMRCHWNEESWSWNNATSLKVTQADLGRWIHFALVVSPTAVDYYMNGMRYRTQRNMSKTRINTELMLGQDLSGDKWFKGAFDQVAVWNRSLSQEEVIYYMQHGVRLDDEALLAYGNMESYDDQGYLVEAKSGDRVRISGNAEYRHSTMLPFKPVAVEAHTATTTDSKVMLITHNGISLTGTFSVFDKYPYNYADYSRSGEMPLSQSSYTFISTVRKTYTDSDMFKFAFKHENVKTGENYTLKIRPLGSQSVFADNYTATAEVDGAVTFTVPAKSVPEAMEMMIMEQLSGDIPPVKAEVSLVDADRDPQAYILYDAYDNIILNVKKVSSGTADNDILATVSETEYASISDSIISPSTGTSTIVVKIDKEKINKFAWNPVTVVLQGAEAEPFRLNVALEPRVNLSLEDGGNEYVATDRVVTLPVKVEVVQGVMPENVELETIADISTGLNTDGAYLFSNSKVQVTGLEFANAANSTDDGWNLVGNPYAANINLTKEQNVSFNSDDMVKFMYQYDPDMNAYLAYDMTIYDAEQHVRPFSPFFVQALHSSAEMTITPVAKSTSINRKVYSFDMAEEQNAVYVSLYANGKVADRMKIVFDDEASEMFVQNEDAIKMFSINDNANEIYTKVYKHNLSINTMPDEKCDIPVGLRLSDGGDFRVEVDRITGHLSGSLSLVDSEFGFSEEMVEGMGYDFNVMAGGELETRLMIRYDKKSSGVDKEEKDGYPVWAKDGYCHVSRLKGDAMIRIFDTAGRLMVSERTKEPTYSTPLPDGVFVVKIVENGKEFVAKILVK